MSSLNKHAKASNNQITIAGGRLLQRHHDFFSYTFFGFLASVVNIASFFLFRNLLSVPYFYANIIAFFIANLFSFFMNKHIVFTTNADDNSGFLIQLGLFFAYRLISLIPDNLTMFIGLSWLQWNSFIVKIIDQVIVGIFNYFTTRSVFKKETNYLRRKLQENLHKDSPSKLK